MQFQVPQFLDIEDKVIGPLTIKQFLYVTGGVGMAYITIRIIPWFTVGVIPAIGFLILGGMLAFYKFNNKPFVFLIESAFNYSQSSRLYIWRRRNKSTHVSLALDLSNFKTTKHTNVGMPGVNNGSKLNDLTWAIDVEKGSDITTDRMRVGSI